MYLSITADAGDLYKESQTDYNSSAELKQKADQQLIESQNLIDQTAKTADPDVQLKLLKKSEELDALALMNRKAADSLNTTARDKQKKAKQKEDESKQYLLTVDSKLQPEIIANTPKIERSAPVDITTVPDPVTTTFLIPLPLPSWIPLPYCP